jgi:xanthine dehydrogenase accessory factor
MSMNPTEAIKKALDRGAGAALVTVTEVRGEAPSRVGMKLAVDQEGAVFGTLGCDGFDSAGEADARKSLSGVSQFEAQYPWHDGSAIIVSVKQFKPGDRIHSAAREIPELLIVGGGPVARALLDLGEPLGFNVRVAAGPNSPKVGEFEGADEVVVVTEVRDVEALRPNANTYVVICGHDESFSQPVLRTLIRSEAPYLGMMGSRRHTSHLYEELRTAGFSEADLKRVHTPVGLDLGAETPEEIALSVLAQIVAIRRGGSGTPLDLAT